MQIFTNEIKAVTHKYSIKPIITAWQRACRAVVYVKNNPRRLFGLGMEAGTAIIATIATFKYVNEFFLAHEKYSVGQSLIGPEYSAFGLAFLASAYTAVNLSRAFVASGTATRPEKDRHDGKVHCSPPQAVCE